MPIEDPYGWGPGEGEDAPQAIRHHLSELGVDVAFWKHRFGEPEEDGHLTLMESEFDSDDLREAKREVRRILVDAADDAGREARSWGAGEEEQRIPDLLDGASPHLIPALAILIGDKLARDGDEGKAMAAYRQAVDLAPTAQSQMEVGYLLARRGQVAFPVKQPPWYYQDILLPPYDVSVHDRWSFPGLGNYQVIFEELLPGPKLEDPRPALRLALEAYGRVFARCFPPDEAGATIQRFPRMSFDCLVIDGLHVLLSSIDAHDENLISACFWTLWYAAKGGFAEEVEERLRISEIYLRARKEGREDAESVQQGVEIARRTVVLTDPDAFRLSMIEDLRSALGSMPAVERLDLGDFFRGRFSGWSEFPSGVQMPLLAAEKEFREKSREGGQDFAGAIVYYGRAAEAALRFVSESNRTSLGEFSGSGPAKSLLRARLKPAAPLDWLVSTLGDIAGSMRNQAAHGSVEHRAFSESECDRCRTKVFEVIECLMKHRVRSGR